MTLSIAFDPLSAEFAADPYQSYSGLRELDAPFYWADLDMVLLSKFEDVSQVALDSNCVRSLKGHRSTAELLEEKRKSGFSEMPFHERFVQSNLLDTDGPEHSRLRQLVFGAFTAKAVKALEDDVRGFVHQILETLPSGKQIDFITEVAAPLPALVIARFLGVPDGDAAQLGRWSHDIVAYYDVDKTPRKKQAAEDAVHAFHDYLAALKTERKMRPQDDLISKMVTLEEADVFKGDECIATCMLILMAGHGSSIDVIGTGLNTLLKHPKAIAELRANTGSWPQAIEEMFRYEPPLPFFHRHAVRDIHIRGHVFPTGTTFGLLYASANRDKVFFENPEIFDIHRKPNRHIAFGRGAHLCLGNQLAKLNMRILFEELFSRFSTIEIAGMPKFKHGLSVRGLDALPVELS